jgi:hypothetical protein
MGAEQDTGPRYTGIGVSDAAVSAGKAEPTEMDDD